jgi:hypothetical protein
MCLEEACSSLKLECALREIGFVDIGWKCVAHGGLFFVQPVGWGDECDSEPWDELLGFLLRKHIQVKKKSDPRLLCNTAKKALDLAQEITDASLNDW